MQQLKVNHFKITEENGMPIWYWEDSPGHSCGRDRKWRYEVQIGDQELPIGGTCAEGYAWKTIQISGTATRIV